MTPAEALAIVDAATLHRWPSAAEWRRYTDAMLRDVEYRYIAFADPPLMRALLEVFEAVGFALPWLRFLREHRVAGLPDVVVEAIKGCGLAEDKMCAALAAVESLLEERHE